MSSHRAAFASAAFATGPPDHVLIQMDAALVTEGVLDTGNWSVRYNNFIYTVTAAQCGSNTVDLTVTQAGADAGPDVVSYAPPPFDLVSLLSGLEVYAFADQPIT